MKDINIDLTDFEGNPAELELSEKDIEFLAKIFAPVVQDRLSKVNT